MNSVPQDEAPEPPGSRREGLLSPGYVDCLQACMALKGERIPKAVLMGLTGEAFRLFYDKSAPDRSPYVLAHNPLRAASTVLGYSPKVNYYPDTEQAMEGLDEHLAADAAILHAEGGWVSVLRREPPAYVVQMADERQERWDRDRLMESWQREAGFLELGLPGFYFFGLGEKERKPDMDEVAVATLRRGVRLMRRRTKVGGAAAGLLAYEDMAESLRRKPRGYQQAALDVLRYSQWREAGVPYVHAARQAAVEYLDTVRKTFTEEAAEHLEKAAKAFRKAAELFEEMPAAPALQDGAHPPTGADKRAVRGFSRARKKIIRLVYRLHAVETEAADGMRKGADIQERYLRR